jgi:peroxiredoxin
MTSQTKQKNTWAAVTVFIVITIFAGCKKGADEKSDLESYRYEIASSESIPESPNEFVPQDTELKTGAKTTISDIVRSATTWRPAYMSLYGRVASDFSLPDIHGQQYQLSNYRGKNVIVTFWTTWCPGCKEQISDLIALRKLIGKDDLTILTVSFLTRWPSNTTIVVKKFAEYYRINYPIISVESGKLPAPYNQVTSIPCTFFIDSEGKIRLVAEGLIPLSHMRAVLEAEQ